MENIDEFKPYMQKDKKVYVVTFAPENDATLFEFRGLLTPHNNLYDRKNLTSREAMRLIADSKQVVTCRYHGLVMANTLDKEVKVVAHNLKTYSEVKPKSKLDALGHISRLKGALANGKKN